MRSFSVPWRASYTLVERVPEGPHFDALRPCRVDGDCALPVDFDRSPSRRRTTGIFALLSSIASSTDGGNPHSKSYGCRSDLAVTPCPGLA